jgi:hypothetical protein
MIVSTILNLAIIPALYLIVAGFDRRHDVAPPPPQRPAAPATAAGPIPLEK